MKKILLIIALTLCIFQMIVLATAIDIGGAAINRGDAWTLQYCVIIKDNPANDTGTITSIEIWAQSNLSSVIVGTCYEVSANHYTTRDYESIGNVTSGSKQTFSGLSIDVQTGDYLSIKGTGNLEVDSSGGDGVLAKQYQGIPFTNEEFTLYAGYVGSLYGTGTTEGAAEEANAVFFGINF